MHRISFGLITTLALNACSGRGVTSTTDGGSGDSGSNEQRPWQLPPGHFEPAKLPLTIIAPRPGLTTTNRYYKAYPGIAYDVPVSVLGGAWPFEYTLTTAPAGMTIGEHYGDARYGQIYWENPTVSASPHPVSVRVRDQEGHEATVSFSVTVTTDGFLFLDAVNGNDANPGTLASPKQTINGWYRGAKSDSTYSGSFVYYRAGTYRTDAGPIEDGIRLANTGTSKPSVHLAYPGETATIDVRNAHLAHYSGVRDVFFSGLTFDQIGNNNAWHALAFDSDTQRVVIYKNTFNRPVGGGGVGSNSSSIFIANGGTVTPYWALVYNDFVDTYQVMAVEAYLSSDAVFEGNRLNNNSAGGLYLKNSNPRWSIRGNEGLTNNSAFLVRVDAYNGAENVDDIEVCWNNYASSGVGWILGYERNDYGTFTSYRNTWQVNEHSVVNAQSATLNVIRDVIQHTGGFANGVHLEGTSITPFYTDPLAGESGLVDSNGKLVGQSRTNYLGIRGHEAQ